MGSLLVATVGSVMVVVGVDVGVMIVLLTGTPPHSEKME